MLLGLASPAELLLYVPSHKEGSDNAARFGIEARGGADQRGEVDPFASAVPLNSLPPLSTSTGVEHLLRHLIPGGISAEDGGKRSSPQLPRVEAVNALHSLHLPDDPTKVENQGELIVHQVVRGAQLQLSGAVPGQ